MTKSLYILIAVLIIISCKSTDIKTKNSFQIQDDTINLYAFIGKKISMTEFDSNEGNTEIEIDSMTGDTATWMRYYVMDRGFKASYKVLSNVFNNLKKDAVNFVVYDHYGKPKFKNYKYVMLYLSLDDKGDYYHQKYQYDPVKKSKDGNWIGLKGESIEKLFMDKKNGVLKNRGVF